MNDSTRCQQMKKACNPREPEERLFQSSNQQNTRETQVLHSSASKHHALCNTSLSCQCSSRPDSQDFFQHMQHMHDSVQSPELTGSLSSYQSSGLMASWPHQTNPASVPLQSNSFTPVKVVDGARNSKFGATFRNDLIFANSTWIR